MYLVHIYVEKVANLFEFSSRVFHLHKFDVFLIVYLNNCTSLLLISGFLEKIEEAGDRRWRHSGCL